MASRNPNHRHDCPCNECVRRRNARRRREADRYSEEGRPLPQGSQLYEIERGLPPVYETGPMEVRDIVESVLTRSNRHIPPTHSDDALSQIPAPDRPIMAPVQPRGRGGGRSWLVAILLIAAVLGGTAYVAMRSDLLGPLFPNVSPSVLLPTPAPTPTPAELRPTATPPITPPNSEAQTPIVPTPTVSHTPTPIPTPTPIATPTIAIVVVAPTEQEIVVNAFAECDGQYSGADHRFRAGAANLAIEEGRQTVADIRRLVDEYCNGAIPVFSDAMQSNQDTDTSTERSASTKPTATSVPTPTSTAPPLPTKVPTLRPKPTSTATTSGDGRFDQSEMEAAIHQRINAYRKEQGRSELKWDNRLASIALEHSEDMARHNFYSHTNRAGDDPTARARKAGYNCQNPRSIGIAENIHVLYGHTSMLYGRPYTWETQERMIQRFVEDWINSSRHSQIMLDRRYTKTGIGVGFGPYNGISNAIFVTQNFC